eukprot:691545-Pyramimonas_sp.AAC.1
MLPPGREGREAPLTQSALRWHRRWPGALRFGLQQGRCRASTCSCRRWSLLGSVVTWPLRGIGIRLGLDSGPPLPAYVKYMEYS